MGPPQIAFSWDISVAEFYGILWFMADIAWYTVTNWLMGVINQDSHHWGAPSCIYECSKPNAINHPQVITIFMGAMFSIPVVVYGSQGFPHYSHIEIQPVWLGSPHSFHHINSRPQHFLRPHNEAIEDGTHFFWGVSVIRTYYNSTRLTYKYLMWETLAAINVWQT